MTFCCAAPPPDLPGYVGSAACVECHAEESARWRGSHHDLAMDVASEESVRGDFDGASFGKDGVTSTFTRNGDRFVVRTDGADGELADFEVLYTFGTSPLQQYLVELDDGRVQALPLAWDTRPEDAGGQRWFHLYPDERIPPRDPLHWTGPNHNWNFMCAECHSTNVVRNYDESRNRYATTWSEIDVGCESCHGPGSAHVDATRGGAKGAEGLVMRFDRVDPTAWVLAPGQDIAERRAPPSDTELNACARCHARRHAIAPTYEYGRPLTDTHAPDLLEAGLYHAAGQPIEEVYVYGSFLQSRMHASGVTCADCHDPHSLALHAEGNALCARCHQVTRYDAVSHHHHAPGTEAAACVSCHMPARTYMVVDERRDHSFRVPRPDLRAETGAPDVCTDCHRERDADWAAARVVEWYGPERRRGPDWAVALQAGRRRSAAAPALLRAAIADSTVPGIVRATALSRLAPWPRAALAAGVAALGDPDPLVRSAALPLCGALPPTDRATRIGGLLGDGDLSVRIAAARVLTFAPVPEELGPALARAQTELEAAELANVDRAEPNVNLGVLALARGDTTAAVDRYRRALELDAGCVPARVNFADLDRGPGEYADGESILREGLRVRPDAALLHHALGLLLVRKGRAGEAIGPFATAARLAPDESRFAYVHAIALHSTGRPDEALRLLERLHDRFPGDLATLEALVSLHRDAGDATVANGYAALLADLR